MGAITNKCFELIEEGRYVEEPRKKYVPLPQWEDWELDGRTTPGDDQEDREEVTPPPEGEPQEDQSNPLRRGDNSTII